MRLILGSDITFVLKYGYKLTNIPKADMKIGYITTASKVLPDQAFFTSMKKQIRDNGYSFEEIDITKKTRSQLLNAFEDKNVIHIEGGNTFYLLKVIRETNFGLVLKELLEEGKIYIGTSAGAYIMCPTIEVANWNIDGYDRFGLTDLNGLNYIPFLLRVHYSDNDKALLEEKITTLKYPLQILKDGQGILIEDDICKFIGSEKQTKLKA